MVRGTIFSVKRAGQLHGPGVLTKQTGVFGAVGVDPTAAVSPPPHPSPRGGGGGLDEGLER